jgi:ArsR family transcriptional regulator
MELSNYSKIFKALSNEQRLKIFMIIYEGCCGNKGESVFPVKSKSCCLGNGTMEKAFTKVCVCVNISRSTVSHHFKELQAAGLIACEREGQNYRCRVNSKTIEELKKFLK